MTNNQKEWWEDDLRRMFHGVWGASPWNEKRMTDAAIESIKPIFAEARSRFKEEAIMALEGAPGHILEPASSDGIFYDEASFNAGHRLAKQAAIETMKNL